MADESCHLLEADANNCGLGVPAEVQAVTETGPKRNNVFERAAELHSWNVMHRAHTKCQRVKQLQSNSLLLRFHLVITTQCGLTELALGHFIGNIGAHKHRNTVPR